MNRDKICRLNLGCGLWLKKGFINVDKFFTEEQIRSKKGAFIHAKIEKNAKFIQADIGSMPFKDNYADFVEMNQVIEHFPMRQVVTYMREVYRVMKKGGKLVLTAPNFTGVAADWISMVVNPPFNFDTYIDLAEIIYGNQLSEGESHRCPFTSDFLNFVLTSAGFTDGKIYMVRKGTPVKAVKFLVPLKKNSVFRNDNLVAEVIK
jgi:predicted SAM-dependent methyltransferase